MARALLPFHVFATRAAVALIGPDIQMAALKAMRAAIRNGRGFDIAHQHISWGEHDLAFSSRVTETGDVVIELDVGDPGLADRVVLEADLRRELRRLADERTSGRRRRGLA